MGPSAHMRSAFVVVAALGGACGKDALSGADASPPGRGQVEIGTGTTAFEPLADDGEMILIAGPQGGHHFVVHARIRDLEPGDPERPGLVANPATRFLATSEGGERLHIDVAPYRLGYVADGDGHVLTSGRILQLRDERVASTYGTRVHLAVEVTDSAGATARDERWVVAVAEPVPDAGAPNTPDGAPPP